MKFLFKAESVVLCAILVCLLFCSAGRAEVVDRIVANVDGQIILYSDLQNQIGVLKKRMPSLDMSDPQKKTQIEHAVLQQMIDEKLADLEAKKLKINVSDSDVDKRLDQLLQMNHMTMEQLKKKLEANGDSLKNMRKEIKQTIARQELMQQVLKSKVIITDQEVDAYMGSQKGQETTTSKGVHLALIVLPFGGANPAQAVAKKTGLELVKKLQGGADFKAMAIKYSKGPAAQDGGDVGFMAQEDVAPFIAKAIEGLKKGQVSNLAQGPNGYYIVKILDVGQNHTTMASSASREQVRQMLYEQAMRRMYQEWLKKLESKAFIHITL
ncbi:MAG: SurA N-terminal domain-containing protein [Syntrophobacteraceae bacterium]